MKKHARDRKRITLGAAVLVLSMLAAGCSQAAGMQLKPKGTTTEIKVEQSVAVATAAKTFTNKDNTIQLKQLSDKLWIQTTYKDIGDQKVPSNGLIVSTEAGLVLLDTAWDDTLMQEVMTMINQHIQKKVVLAVITHAHMDRIGGIKTLLDQGIKVQSSSLTARLALKQGYPEPSGVLDENPKFQVGETEFETYYPGAGHTVDNLVVWLPQTKTLFGGCVVLGSDATKPGNTDDAYIAQWPDSVRQLMTTYKEAKFVIPGHGTWGDYSLLQHTLDLLLAQRT
ncbi:subclass B1 metallo-beta-lactamase [Paenibacillus sp. ACRRX]|uniref:subclass B1 metallo-beta-lactamase n=1 Tax=Paenibacillus sp. ACRRX TaxID=2918206 RepID=UPI001EF71B06|nr:subclass B1 metallo-beta-lactamase [Paenibacillus sp. ACRRX]MCG7410487.1 subclass B1 metallo-beta-lactamase [Paenibacillus sp. ACRRX]